MDARPARQCPSPSPSAPADRSDRVRSENVFCRNYDLYRRYTLAVTVRDGEDDARFEPAFVLRPGQAESVCGVLPAGTYGVTVAFEESRRKTRSLRVSPDPDHTIHVEVGNGVLSLTEGLYG